MLLSQGCLASILASSYEYDFDLNDLNDSDTDHVAASFHLYDVDDDDDDDSGIHMSPSQEDLSSGNEIQATQSQSSVSTSCYQEEEEEGSRSPIEQDGRPPRHKSVSRERRQETSSRKQANPLNFSLLRDDKTALERARSRHRKRRYDMFSTLLLSSADHLLLDKSQAKAFIPMLRALLTPPRKPAEEVKQMKHSNSMSAMWLRRTSPKKQSSRPSSSHGDKGYKSDSGSNEQTDLSRDSSFAVESGGDFDDDDRYFMLRDLGDADIIRAFLESLSPGSGFRCLSLLLLQHLLRSEEGYDARVRHVFKKLGVIVLVHEMEREQYSFGPDGEKIQLLSNAELAKLATRKFEALEQGIAIKLIRLSELQRSQKERTGRAAKNKSTTGSSREMRRGLSREQIVRGLKVGSAGLVAGTLFAVTGGLAAPGIAAGIAAIAGSAAATAAVVTLTSTAAVTAIFGVGGGGLAAYKMNRRTQGLTEFTFQKESQSGRRSVGRPEPELFSTICISGWLTEQCDYQRPWGVTPTNPPIYDRTERLERFYMIYRPERVPKCSRILSDWKNEEKELWKLLKQKYGRDPDHLFPLDGGPRQKGALTLEEDEVLDQLFIELGHVPASESQDEKTRAAWKTGFRSRTNGSDVEQSSCDLSPSSSAISRDEMSLEESLRGARISFQGSALDGPSSSSSAGVETADSSSTKNASNEQTEKEVSRRLMTVWDYHANYGGELYTIKWESAMLMELCDSVTDLAVEVLEKATTQILKTTILAALVSAVALPQALLAASNMIDGSWTLAIERSDEAGKELAKSLLFSRAGHRPVTLVGFSMGARAIYSCLKELASYQEKWEDAREKRLRFPKRASGKNESADDENNFAADETVEIFEGMREPASIVEDVILMGLPNHLNKKSWVACRQIVGGRLVNCYSRTDLILSLMFQIKRMTTGLKKVCGTNPIDVPGVENFNVTDLIPGHQDYCFATGEILKRVRHGQPIRSKQRPVSDDDGAASIKPS